MIDLPFLPQEIIDMIMLKMEWSDLEKCRDIQSQYVKNITESNDIISAIRKENIDNLHWICSKVSDNLILIDNQVIEEALMTRNINVLKCVLDKGFSLEPEYGYIYNDISNKILHFTDSEIIMMFCKRHSFMFDEFYLADVVMLSDLDLIKFLHMNGKALTFSCWQIAQELGNKDIIEWLVKNRCPTELNEIEIELFRQKMLLAMMILAMMKYNCIFFIKNMNIC